MLKRLAMSLGGGMGEYFMDVSYTHVNILQPPSFFSLILQNDSLDIVQRRSSVKLVSKKKIEKDGKKFYQGMK